MLVVGSMSNWVDSSVLDMNGCVTDGNAVIEDGESVMSSDAMPPTIVDPNNHENRSITIYLPQV